MRVLGIDLGRRRIGLAVSDATRTLARPLRTIQAGPSDPSTVGALAEIVEALAAEPDGLEKVVIGLPKHLDGSPSEQTAHVQGIAASLQQRLRLPVVLQDERLSSREAESRLAVQERDWRKRKAKLDAAAAAVVLQDYLDAHAESTAPALPNGDS